MTGDILRYLGMDGTDPDPALEREIRDAVEELSSANRFRSVHLRLPCRVTEDGIAAGSLLLPGRALAGHLEGCGELILLAATLGPEPDRLISRHSLTRMGRAAVTDAAATALLERRCDELTAQLAEEAAPLVLRPRFSPGYGDLPLTCQREILSLLDAGKRLGLTLTEGLMLAPSKSVTAIIGLGSGPVEGLCASGCQSCALAHCAFRKE